MDKATAKATAAAAIISQTVANAATISSRISKAATSGVYSIRVTSESYDDRLADESYMTAAIKIDLEFLGFAVIGIELDPSTTVYNAYTVDWS